MLILAVWLTLFARILRRPVAVTLIGDRLRFTRCIGSFDRPVHALRLVTTSRAKDDWKTVHFCFRGRTIETWPLRQLARLTQTLQTLYPAVEVRNVEEKGPGGQPPRLSLAERSRRAPPQLAQAVHDRPQRLQRPIADHLRRPRPSEQELSQRRWQRTRTRSARF